MKHSIIIMMALLLATDAFSAGPGQLKPVLKVEATKKTETKTGTPEAAKPTTVESVGALKDKVANPTTDKAWAETRLNGLLDKAKVAMDTVTKRDLIESMTASIDVRQAVNSLDATVKKMIDKGGRLNNLQQKMVEISIDWLAKAKGEKDLNEIHMVFEDALSQNYAGVIAQILKKSLEYQKTDKSTLSEATRKALEERGITREDVKACKKGA